MLDCSEILKEYSDYRDGLIDGARLDAFTQHLAECRRCARYDRVVRRGTDLLREIEPVEPSDDFIPRLKHRIYHVQDEIAYERGLTRATSPMALAAIAASIALVAWLPALRPTEPAVLVLPAAQAHAPHPLPTPPALLDDRPLFPDRATVSQASHSFRAPTASTLFFEYSPLNRYTLTSTQQSVSR